MKFEFTLNVNSENNTGDAEREEVGRDSEIKRKGFKTERPSYQTGEGAEAAHGQDDSVPN